MSPRSIRAGLRRLFRRADAEGELSDEVRHYLEESTRAHMSRGLPRAEAERAARMEFGGVESAKEAVRDAGWESGIDGVLRDFRYALRGLRRNPSFTIVAVATLALGLGATTAMFSVVNAVVLRPLPYADPSRLVMLWTDDVRRGIQDATPYRTTVDWQEQTRSLAGIGTFAATSSVLIGGGTRERVASAFVSASLFRVLGVTPLLGSAITEEQERSAERVAVISHGLWQRRFGGDPSVLGKLLELEETAKGGPPSSRIVGVMPASFFFPDRSTEFWVPQTLYWRWGRETDERFAAFARRWSVVARIKPGLDAADVRADMATIARRLTQEYPASIADFPGFSVATVPLLDQVTGVKLKQALWILLGAVGLVLLIACANVANLLLARGAGRVHEFALRQALGGSRARLFRQVLVESSVLAVAAGAFGVGLAVIATRVLSHTAAARLPRLDDVPVDGAVLGFAAVALIFAGIAFGIAPAVRWSRASGLAMIQENGRQAAGSRRLRGVRGMLLASECALALVLLVGAGLLLRSFGRLMSVAPGFESSGVLSVRIELPRTLAGGEKGPLPPGQVSALRREADVTRVMERIRKIPGVAGVAVTNDLFIRYNATRSITVPGSDVSPGGQLNEANVTPDFFQTLRVPLIRGRHLTRADAFTFIQALWPPRMLTGVPVLEQQRIAIAEPVVVNESFARRYFPGEDPVGRRFVDDPNVKPFWYEIVGVVGDMRRRGLEREVIPEIFGPFFPTVNAEFLVRAAGDPLRIATDVRAVVTAEYPHATVLSVSTADRRMGEFATQRKLQTTLLGAFAAIALVVAAIGIFGVVQYTVAERTREIGVRIALGATASDVVSLIVREGMRLPLLGIAVGLAAAFVASRLMTHLLFGVEPTDPLTFVGVAALLGAVAAVACYLPSRRATRIDPSTALRQE
jgi:putative ABC transport system permease protein